MEAIEVKELRKSYESKELLKGLSFTVRRGEIFALLGVNGAGKTTTLECIEGLRPYDSGTIHVRGRLGIQLQSSSLPPMLKAGEALRFFARLNGCRQRPAYTEALDISSFSGSLYQTLSTGQKRRLHLALALLNDPDIVILDEPTAGLDVEGRHALHELIRRLKDEGKTILLSSHDMAEVESLSDRLAILKDGVIAFCGSTEELGASLGRHFTIKLKTTGGITETSSGDIVRTLQELLRQTQEKGEEILDLQIDRGNLEQHFIEMARRTH